MSLLNIVTYANSWFPAIVPEIMLFTVNGGKQTSIPVEGILHWHRTRWWKVEHCITDLSYGVDGARTCVVRSYGLRSSSRWTTDTEQNQI